MAADFVVKYHRQTVWRDPAIPPVLNAARREHANGRRPANPVGGVNSSRKRLYAGSAVGIVVESPVDEMLRIFLNYGSFFRRVIGERGKRHAAVGVVMAIGLRLQGPSKRKFLREVARYKIVIWVITTLMADLNDKTGLNGGGNQRARVFYGVAQGRLAEDMKSGIEAIRDDS